MIQKFSKEVTKNGRHYEKIGIRLQIPRTKSHFDIVGIGGQRQSCNKDCQLVIGSKKHDIPYTISAIILSKVTKRLPSVSFEIANPTDLDNLELADPNFNESSQIDMILGNDSERFINIEGIRKNICGNASAYNTIFGWVLSGPMRTETTNSFTTTVTDSEEISLCNILRKFWELEEIPKSPCTSAADKFCEDFFCKNYFAFCRWTILERLPFKKEFSDSCAVFSHGETFCKKS